TDIEYIDGNIWIIKGKSLYVIHKSRLGYNYGSFNTIFTNIAAGSNLLLMNGSFYKEEVNGIKVPLLSQSQDSHPRLRYSMNDISFSWTTTCYLEEERTEYRYKLEGFDNEWSNWSNNNFKEFTNLPPGQYQFKVRSSTITGLGSKETTFSFSVLNPWYRTFVAVTIYILIAFITLYYSIRIYTRRLRKEKIYLAKLLKKLRVEMTRQKEELETGIRYAGRTLAAHLPDEKLLADSTSNYFILYRPIEQASGDFYWISRKDDRLFVAAADCTGHGIQGASLSLLGISLLNSIINRPGFHNADQVITELRNEIVASFNKSGDSDVQKDNIKMALLVFDYSNGVVEFSGAYNPCF
ncbi:MAG: SpoIIE family protein phosphatase, partial [Bacteroidales bacterium]|nr:SpoIIE family protein phosphatase [Bacteroidales bacterium]